MQLLFVLLKPRSAKEVIGIKYLFKFSRGCREELQARGRRQGQHHHHRHEGAHEGEGAREAGGVRSHKVSEREDYHWIQDDYHFNSRSHYHRTWSQTVLTRILNLNLCFASEDQLCWAALNDANT